MTNITDLKFFELKLEHIKLLTRSYVEWQHWEDGAACIDPKRPYGNSHVPSDIAEILDINMSTISKDVDGDWEITEDNEQKLLDLHKETDTALQIILALNTFEPGFFKKTDRWDQMKWKRITKEEYIAEKI